jgi:DNA repair protein SbcC/Rad50
VKPVRLEAQGFGAFREATAIDFEDAELFALVGPTGSGKSTVIDAICFALYGSVPRYGHKGSVAPIITTGALEARVSLTFEAGGTRYVATRVVRRQKSGSGAATREARLEAVDGDVLAGSVGEIDASVEDLLGLTFEHFTRAVVLPQNEFARFLHDKPAARQDLLVRLLGFDVYERMMRAARNRAAEQESAVKLAEQRIESLADCTPEQLAVWVEWLTLYAELRKDVRTARSALTALAEAVAAAEAGAQRERDVVQRLGQVKMPAAVTKLTGDREQAVAAQDAATAAVAAAATRITEAEQALAAAGERDPLLAARAAHTELAQVRTGLDKARGRAEGAVAAVEPASAEVAELEAQVEQLRVEHAAHTLVATLEPGEPCPVCEQVVATIPRRGKAPAASAALRKKLETARKGEQDRRAKAAAAQQSVAELVARERALATQLADAPGSDELERRLAAMETAGKAVDAARRDESVARRKEQDAREAVGAVDGKLQQAAARFRDQRDALVGVGVSPPAEQGELAADWPALVEWAAVETPAREKAAAKADAAAGQLRAKCDEELGALVDRAREADVTVKRGAGPDELLDAIEDAEREAKTEQRRIEDGIAERTRLEKEVAASGAGVQVARELARLLDARNFERWLVAEALELLVNGASVRLRELSAGQYSFAFEESSRDFLVVDHFAADEVRSVRTLSGGETFQASLALALALADQLADLAADGAARLESIFLDEGFGSLDLDTLETVAATIENLGADDRTVGIVTHVRDLAERMPVQFVVSKGPKTAVVQRVNR